MRKLATIETIAALDPIQGADQIERATVKGWELVVKKGEFKVGDRAVYIEIDSLVPDEPVFEFLRARKFRVRTIKLRGQISQGLAIPTSVLPDNLHLAPVGTDVTEILGIKKYDPETPTEETNQGLPKKRYWTDKYLMRYAWYRKLRKPKTKGWPSWIPKTDEERIQNMTTMVRRLYQDKTPLLLMEKLDGSSITCFVEKKRGLFGSIWEFGVCSRKIRLTSKEGRFWDAATKLDVKDKLIRLAINLGVNKLAVQGELIGPGIQKNKYELDEHTVRFFTLHGPDGRIPQEYALIYCTRVGFPFVPFFPIQTLPGETPQECLSLAYGNSELNPNIPREGLVLRSPRDNDVSFKIINNEFITKYDL